MYDFVMVSVIKKYVLFFTITLVLGVLALLVSRKQKKWVFLICIVCLIGVVVLAAVRISPVLIDYKKESYIVEKNAKVICKSPTINFSDLGNSSLKVVTEDGRTIDLWYSGPFDEGKGQFQGTVVYAKRSKIMVFYELEPVLAE